MNRETKNKPQVEGLGTFMRQYLNLRIRQRVSVLMPEQAVQTRAVADPDALWALFFAPEVYECLMSSHRRLTPFYSPLRHGAGIRGYRQTIFPAVLIEVRQGRRLIAFFPLLRIFHRRDMFDDFVRQQIQAVGIPKL